MTGSCVARPACSWELLLAEGPSSLNDLPLLLSHWNGHQSCSSPCVNLLFSLLGSSCGVVCFMICWSVSVTYANLILRICRMDMNVIYYDLWSGKLRNFYVWMICDEAVVVCCVRINDCNLYMWSVSIVSYSPGVAVIIPMS